ncbi:hypothetical protein P4O66_008747 [Electrophorus voltai]|uniref:DIS3-like exonuclease 2 n=1 Tax=Electrophorus voltai TaxID=2609070 RepID=A0AAD8ZD64_9TELE|nr:hypothetical protein P4O66_008747 [Electrophorus voltai]
MEPTHRAKGGSKHRRGKHTQNPPRTAKEPNTGAQNHQQNGPLRSDMGKQSGSVEENVGAPASRSVTKPRRAARGGSEASHISDCSPCAQPAEAGDGSALPGGREGHHCHETPRKPGVPAQSRQRRNIESCETQDGGAGVPSRQLRWAREPKEQVSQLRGTWGKAPPIPQRGTQSSSPPLCDPSSPRGGEERAKNRRKPKADVDEMVASPGWDPTGGQEPWRVRDKAKDQQGQVKMSSPGSSSKKSRGPRGMRRHLFEDYMSLREVSAGLKRGELVQGALRINPRRYHEAFISSPDGSADIFLDGLVARNRALNGDVVVVQPLPPEQRKVENAVESEKSPPGHSSPGQGRHSSPDIIVEAQYSGDEEEVLIKMEAVSLQDKVRAVPEDSEHSNKHSTSGSTSEKVVQRTGKVVYITELKHSRAASGFIKFLPDKTFALFSPVDHRVPRVNVPLTDCPADFNTRPGDYANTLFICGITHWPADSTFAEGRLAKSLGQAGEIDPETEGILAEYDVDCSEFPAESLACLPQNLPWTIPAEELAKRRDLRQECIFTIDPATARDLDDALSCKQLPDGNFEVGVHIADVSYFVEEGSALDLVASRRATSVYLVQKVVPMLPRLLCEELCSLNPQADRLTFSVIWTLSPEGKILSKWFGRSVICSCVKLSYEHAQSLIDAPDKGFSTEELPPCAPAHPIRHVHQAVLHLHALAKHLRAQRFEGGALRLDQLMISLLTRSKTETRRRCLGVSRPLRQSETPLFLAFASSLLTRVSSILQGAWGDAGDAEGPAPTCCCPDVPDPPQRRDSTHFARSLPKAVGTSVLNNQLFLPLVMKLAFCLNADTGLPQGCYVYQYRDSNKFVKSCGPLVHYTLVILLGVELVEEFMLLANMAVAQHVYRWSPRLALLRRHPPPQGRMMDVLQELCQQMGLHMDLSSSGALHKSLNEMVGKDQYSAARKEVLTHLCSRPMQMAVYFCAGILQDEKLFRHYALNVPLYTHFTSPIRRYADLIVHRLLAASLKCGPHLCLTDEEVQKQASHCNDKKTASKRVQELSADLFFSVFVRECGPLDSEAMVMGMLDKAFDVLVLSYGVQKRIYCNAIEGLQSFQFRKVGKRPEMTLIWAAEDQEQKPVRQGLSDLSVVQFQASLLLHGGIVLLGDRRGDVGDTLVASSRSFLVLASWIRQLRHSGRA